MSKNVNKKERVIEIPEEDVKVEEVQTDENVVETPVEEVKDENKPNKVISVLKKAAPIMVLGGLVAAAFALGRHSGTDAACMAMLEDEYGDDDEDDTGYNGGDDKEDDTKDDED